FGHGAPVPLRFAGTQVWNPHSKHSTGRKSVSSKSGGSRKSSRVHFGHLTHCSTHSAGTGAMWWQPVHSARRGTVRPRKWRSRGSTGVVKLIMRITNRDCKENPWKMLHGDDVSVPFRPRMRDSAPA